MLNPYLSEQKTTKDFVIAILSYKYPLAKVQVYNELKQKSGVTFNALNKAVDQLTEARIIEKEGKKYKLSYDWLYSLKKFSENALSRLQDNKGCLIHGVKDIKEEGNITTLSFDNMADMDKYCKSLHEYYYSQLEKGEKVCIAYGHHWWHILYPENEYREEGRNKRFYCVCTKNTPLDEAGNKFKRSLGMNVKYNPKMPFKNMTVYGDTVVEHIVSMEIEEAIDSFFKKAKAIKDLDITKLKQALNKKGKVIVIVNKNKDIASELKASILKNFKG